MKTGIIRTIDELGRIVIPKEVRRSLEIKEGDPLELTVTENGEVLFSKYVPQSETLTAVKNAVAATAQNANELDEETKRQIAESAHTILNMVEKKNILGYPIKESIVMSTDDFDEILDSIYGRDNYESEYSLDGIWVGNENGELPYVDDLTRHLEREVTSVHIDDCDDVGVWITFGKQGANE